MNEWINNCSKFYRFNKFNFTHVASWHVNNFCNFKCDYCVSYAKNFNKKISEETLSISPSEIRKIFDSTNFTWNIILTGGETFYLPNFIELCEELTKNHYISINTNLTNEKVVKQISNKLDPERIVFINASLHPIEREKKDPNFESFIKNYLLLKEKGFYLFSDYVMHPTIFERFEKDYNYLKSKRINLVIKLFRGKYLNKNYPVDYSIEEKSFLNKYSFLIREKFDDYKIPNLNNLNCNAGKNYIQILHSGDYMSCTTSKKCFKDVNIFKSKRIVLNEKSKKCSYDECSCPNEAVYSNFLYQ